MSAPCPRAEEVQVLHAHSDGLTRVASDGVRPVPVRLLSEVEGASALAEAGEAGVAYARLQDFRARPGELLLLQDGRGGLSKVLFGVGPEGSANPMALRSLASSLPPGDYALETVPAGLDVDLAVLGFALGSYRFDRYKAEPGKLRARLVVEAGDADLEGIERTLHACTLARDMVNTPANDMGPLQIETIAREIATAHGAQIEVVVGDDLLEGNYPAVHAVGRAAAPDRAPRMIEIQWRGPTAPADAPLVAIVGKGVVFDTGGLDIKPSSGMRLMKKDMGGAAHALALGRMIMGAGLPVRLAVLVPAVENAISASAMRPGDVIGSRKGLSVEVGNTDAEGRLILADALTRAAELRPDLTIDLATLTGAARVALGPEVIPFYTDDEALSEGLQTSSRAVFDPIWRMPLWAGYAPSLNSDVADLKNDPDAWAQAGSVTAALFLKRFAPSTGEWAHFDIFAWNPRGRPGWPVGAEVQAIRAAFSYIGSRYGAAG